MKLKSLCGVILTLIIASGASAAPQEKVKEVLTRTAQSELTLRTELSKNIYKDEAYQAEYTEQVPYQADETYYVDVPYQAQETYYERIPYQEQETYWENVPYTERVSYIDYEDYYDREYQCRSVTKYRQECRNENVCEPGRRQCQDVTECGTNAHGERICKTRQHCSDGPRQCRDIPRCQQVPYYDQECGYENVRKSRQVTRYRDETRYRQEQRTRTVTKYREEQRTRTVTKYRKEERTRTVTKYREETRCCVTAYRPVFDRQYTQPVSVIFPAESALLASEKESIQLVLGGTEQAPEVQVVVQSNVFKYEVAVARQEGREKVFVLKVLPKWNAANAGSATVSGLKLAFIQGQGKISFTESFADSRIQTAYLVEVRDQQSQGLVFEKELTGSSAKVIEIPAAGLAREGKYLISLRVLRQGVSLEGGRLEFAHSASYEKKELDQNEVRLLSDKSQVQLVRIEGAGSERIVVIKDQTFAAEEIQSTYKLVVWKKLSSGKIEWLGEKSFARASITRGEELAIGLKSLNLNPPSSTKLYMDLVVNRQSAQYLGSKKVQFIVNKTF